VEAAVVGDAVEALFVTAGTLKVAFGSAVATCGFVGSHPSGAAALPPPVAVPFGFGTVPVPDAFGLGGVPVPAALGGLGALFVRAAALAEAVPLGFGFLACFPDGEAAPAAAGAGLRCR